MHAGDPLVMAAAVQCAAKHGMSVGAHPGFNDLWGFGRRAIRMAPQELEQLVLYQLGALQLIARAHGAALTHVKPHGALNNMAHDDLALAQALAQAVYLADPTLIFVANVGSQMAVAAHQLGLRVANEVFADRRYGPGARLLPRDDPDALISDPTEATEHVLRMVREQAVFAMNGQRIDTAVHTVCVHGDGAHALAIAAAVRSGLLQDGRKLVSLCQVMA